AQATDVQTQLRPSLARPANKHLQKRVRPLHDEWKSLQKPREPIVAISRVRFVPQVLCMPHLRAHFPIKMTRARQLGSCFAFRLGADISRSALDLGGCE